MHGYWFSAKQNDKNHIVAQCDHNHLKRSGAEACAKRHGGKKAGWGVVHVPADR